MSQELTLPAEGRRRVVIENVSPQIDAGRHPIKRTVGERVVVEADIFADSHDALSAAVKFRPETTPTSSEAIMEFVANDRWRGTFVVTAPGLWFYAIEAWIDRFKSWRDDLRKKILAGQDIAVDLVVGVKIIEEAAARGASPESEQLRQWAAELGRGAGLNRGSLLEKVMQKPLSEMVTRHSARRFATAGDPPLPIIVDPVQARCSAWYEMFPRSCAAEPGRHGTFQDCEAQLPRVAAMGFDVLYLPPIHPIGRSFRKGKNNSPVCQEDDPGSPWAVGAAEGGHKSVHPALGTLEDFRRLLISAREQGLEIALDIALQCSADHPYATQHPGWFRRRPDGSIQHAENPPKKYEDIFPFDFECEDWRGSVGGVEKHFRFLGRARRPHFPGGQSAYQALRVLAMVPDRTQAGPPGTHIPGRSLHPPSRDEPTRQTGLHPVLHLFPVAQFEGGI